MNQPEMETRIRQLEAKVINMVVKTQTIVSSPQSSRTISVGEKVLEFTKYSSFIDHGTLAGLDDDDHPQYALLVGRSGGQVLIGGTAVTDTLSLQGTAENGTLTAAAIKFLVGNNGDNQALTVFNNGKILTGAAAPIVGAYLEVHRADWAISASFGDAADGQSDNVYIVGNTINGLYGYDSDTCSIWLNYRGYHGGVTKYRDLYIGDGKQNPVVFVDGSTRKTMFGNGGNPTHIVHIKDDGNAGIGIASNDADGEPYIGFYQGTTQMALIQYNDQGVSTDYLEVQSDGHIYLNPTGNVGIGKTSPAQKLEVNGIIQADDKIIFTQTDGNEYIDSLADGYLDLGATTAIRAKNILIAENAIYFTQTDGNEYIDSLADGYLDLGATTEIRLNSPSVRVSYDFHVGNNEAFDPAISFDGDSNNGLIKFMEDEDYFEFSSAIKLPVLVGAPGTLVNGMIWAEADGVHCYINGAENILDMTAA